MADQGRSKLSKNDRPPLPPSPEANGLQPSSHGLMARAGAAGMALALGVLAVIIVGLFYLFGGSEEQVVEGVAEEGESGRSATLSAPIDGSHEVSVGTEGEQDAVIDAFEGSGGAVGKE